MQRQSADHQMREEIKMLTGARKQAILFDVDDTLYDQTVPFKEAYAEFLHCIQGDFEQKHTVCDGYDMPSDRGSDKPHDTQVSGWPSGGNPAACGTN